MNEFSLVCKIIGSLFYRQPSDPVLTPLWDLLHRGELKKQWPLEQDVLLDHLQSFDIPALTAEFQGLFQSEQHAVSPLRSVYTHENQQSYRQFLTTLGMPLKDSEIDHFGLMLLAASWIEDNSQQDEIQAQIQLFDDYLLPWSDAFFDAINAQPQSDFYRTLAHIAREALQAMREELAENEGRVH